MLVAQAGMLSACSYEAKFVYRVQGQRATSAGDEIVGSTFNHPLCRPPTEFGARSISQLRCE
jgi:hypothetical protein